MREWIDISMPVTPDITGWPGDPAFSLQTTSRISQGDLCNLTAMSLSCHTGTHCDAPWHFVDHGPTLEQVPHDRFFGPALVLDMGDAFLITEDHLPRSPLPPRVLFKTRNSTRPHNAPFDEQFTALDVSAARRLVADGVVMVGVDGLSVAPYGNAVPTHETLLRAGVFVVEGLRLAVLTAGWWEVIVLPMPLVGVDGAPCRAFARRMDPSSA
ncbi:MAG: cyclase family protein [Candidatus Hydrogenedentes bacterium]|nr:cyclase family protein [Candidatus Hydrogenedentota bacterium]